MNMFFEKFVIDPIITTGCIFVGSSPNRISIVIAASNVNIININKFIELILLFINIILLYSIIVYIYINKKINNLLLFYLFKTMIL